MYITACSVRKARMPGRDTPDRSQRRGSLDAFIKILPGRDAESAPLVHDVHKRFCFDRSAACKPQNRKHHLLLVVVGRAALAAVKVSLVGFADLPHGNRHAAALLLVDGEVRAGLADLEQQLVVVQNRCSDRLCIRAVPLHLCVVHVAAVGKVVSLFTHYVQSFLVESARGRKAVSVPPCPVRRLSPASRGASRR